MITKKSKCKCGKEVWIDYGKPGIFSPRTDGKRVYHPENDTGNNYLFRCRGCRGVVAETVPGAGYGTGIFEHVPNKRIEITGLPIEFEDFNKECYANKPEDLK